MFKEKKSFEEELVLYLYNFEIPYSRMICTMFDWNWPAGSGEDLFFNINTCNYGFPIVAPPDPCEPSFEQFRIYIMSESFHVNMTHSGSIILENKEFGKTPPQSALYQETFM
jgi:hypothetical protein